MAVDISKEIDSLDEIITARESERISCRQQFAKYEADVKKYSNASPDVSEVSREAELKYAMDTKQHFLRLYTVELPSVIARLHDTRHDLIQQLVKAAKAKAEAKAA
jgi:hypothetical protein